jgi:hypothetical protein
MEFLEIKDVVIEIIQQENGNFVSVYQICIKMEKLHPKLWQQICIQYKSKDKKIKMGKGTGKNYSPASFVGNALSNFKDEDVRIRQEYFSCKNVHFGDIKTNHGENSIGIWAWKE